MEIVAFVAYLSLVILAIVWTIAVRTDLATDTPEILRAVYFVSAAALIAAFDVNRAHSLWLIPFGCLFSRTIAPALVNIPVLSAPLRLAADVFARITRVGVPRHKIEEAQAAALHAGVEDHCNCIKPD